jgi:hypothetical protein
MDLREVGFGSIDWIDLAQDKERRRILVPAAIKPKCEEYLD